jgi:phosphatidylglycerophosphate synthase
MNTITLKEIANKCHQNKKSGNRYYYYHRLLSLPFTKLFFSLNVTPDTISISMIILSIVSFIFMSKSGNQSLTIGFILAILAFLFDKVDGDLARLYKVANVKGTILDFVYHRLSMHLFYLGLGIHFNDDSNIILITAIMSGFLANYIEEMQLLPHRVFAQKYLVQGEEYIHPANAELHSVNPLRVLKVFRMQLFLFYFFGLGAILESAFNNAILIFLIASFIALALYSVTQLYTITKNSFDYAFSTLLKTINRKQ